mmetsp:Transcript_24961/g.85418  ORF Transcript_24961/g.85418 Transcript_24961/m.85418 type:complete len:260 (-) Transcript_24961:2704-3483(-)
MGVPSSLTSVAAPADVHQLSTRSASMAASHTTQQRCTCEALVAAAVRASPLHAAPHLPLTTACALVPWKAKELTPAYTLAPASLPNLSALHSRGSTLARDTAPTAAATCVLTARRCRTDLLLWCSTPSTASSAPVSPAAHSLWPTYDLPAASCNGSRPAVLAAEARGFVHSTSHAAAASTGSPRAVPVPCMCKLATCDGLARASARAAATTRCCAGPFGAVSELERPSWFTADPGAASAAGGTALASPRSATSHASPRT